MPPPPHEAALDASPSAAASISSTAAASISPTPAMPPPPHEAALDASPSAAASISSSSTSSVLTFRLHPLVVLKLFNRIREYQQASSLSSGTATEDARRREIVRPPRICGCVTGVQRGRTVEVFDSFNLWLDPDSGTLDRDLLEKEQELCKKAFPDLSVLGWYSIGTNVQDTDMQIHQTLMDANGTAFYLLLNPAIKISQKDLPVTIYESVWHHPRFIFVKPNYTIETIDHDASLKPALPLEKGKDTFRMMLLETPSGFAMFCVSEHLLRYPEDIWAWFTNLPDAHHVVRTLGFIQVDNKSVAWDSDVGPGKDLEQFILKFPITKALIVPDAQLKFVIEKQLKVVCWFKGCIVHELIWGLNYVLDEFVPQEKDNLSSERHLPLSKELDKQIKAYGFSISPQLITREFINMVGYLNYLEYASKCISMGLHQRFDRFFRWCDMSDLEFAKAIADNLHSLEEVASKRGKFNKQEILSSIEFILAAPGKKNHTMSLLKHMEVEARAVGPVTSWVWVAVFGLGYAITVGMLARIKSAS